jgi:hypothetical protein
MTIGADRQDQRSERFLLLALAACCTGPVLAIIVLIAYIRAQQEAHGLDPYPPS